MCKITYCDIDTVHETERTLKTVTKTVIENGLSIAYQRDYVIIEDGEESDIFANGKLFLHVMTLYVDYVLKILLLKSYEQLIDTSHTFRKAVFYEKEINKASS